MSFDFIFDVFQLNRLIAKLAFKAVIKSCVFVSGTFVVCFIKCAFPFAFALISFSNCSVYSSS